MEWIEAHLFALASLLLEGLAGLRGLWTVAFVIGLLALGYGMAHLLQNRLARHLVSRPAEKAPLGRLEAKLSIAAPIAYVAFFFEMIVKKTHSWVLRRRQKKQGGDWKQRAEPPSAPAEGTGPMVVATLGPTFFLAGLLSGVLYWLARLSGPLFARSFGLSSDHSFWQYLLLGQRPELAWLLPLDDQPQVAIVLCLVFWMVMWWTLGNVLRGVVYRSELQQNLANRLESALPAWTSTFGVVDLTKPGRSYRWAAWTVTAAILLTVGASTTLGREDWGVAPSALAMALVVTLSWILHLHLRGIATAPAAVESSRESPNAAEQPGWPQVAAELRRLYGVKEQEPQIERAIAPLGLSVKARDVPTLSPLAAELLSDPEEGPDAVREPLLTVMQSKVLESLSLLGYVHLQPPGSDEVLTLQRSGREGIEDRSGLSERNQIVLAPEGSGKTTLAMLAAANHALVHARATLIITRSEAQAEEVSARIRSAVEPSTVRWNLRLRRVGRDFAADLSRGIIPDVLVTSLHQLATSLLDNTEVYVPFLRNVGLVVVDDVESFAGAVEIHAQLAFRRLQLLFRQLAEVEQLGAENSPLVLVLGVDSMKETAAWAKSLCGIQAVVRPFQVGAAKEAGSAEGKERPPEIRQKSFRLSDLTTDTGRPLTVAEVVGACEACGVPWHCRFCGDGRRHRGRGLASGAGAGARPLVRPRGLRGLPRRAMERGSARAAPAAAGRLRNGPLRDRFPHGHRTGGRDGV